MDAPGKHFFSKKIIHFEMIAFVLVIALIWLDEVFDIPYLVLGSVKTPVNWRESLFESVCIALLGAVIVYFSKKIFQRMKYLEGFLPVCAACKKIRDEDGNWQQIESYIRARSAAEFSHGICPECAAKLYPDLDLGN